VGSTPTSPTIFVKIIITREYSEEDLKAAYEEYIECCQPMAGNYQYFKQRCEDDSEFAIRWLGIK